MTSKAARQHRGWGFFAAPAVAYVLGVYVLALAVLVVRSFTDGAEFGLGIYARLLTSAGFQNVLVNTEVLALIAAVFAFAGYWVSLVGWRWWIGRKWGQRRYAARGEAAAQEII